MPPSRPTPRQRDIQASGGASSGYDTSTHPYASTSLCPDAPNPEVPRENIPHLLTNIRGGLEQLLERGGIDARASRQGKVQLKVGACVACRALKIKCSQGHPCRRCSSNKLECVYKQHVKRGRKKEPTPNALLLVSLLRDAEALAALLTGTRIEGKSLEVLRGAQPGIIPAPSQDSRDPLRATDGASRENDHDGDDGRDESSEDDLDDEDHVSRSSNDGDETAQGLEEIIANPLAILAHVATGPKKKGETTAQETGSGAFLPIEYEAVQTANEYFTTGLYEIRLDIAPELDIVNMGLMSSFQFERVIDYYFSNLRSCAFHLNPEFHTPELLRKTSVFLCTVLAYIVAGYLLDLSHLVPQLWKHALRLSDRVFSMGLKSLEIIQAYCLLAEFAPVAPNWGADKQWSWLGQSIRIATELRMDKDTNLATCTRYSSVTKIPNQAQLLFSEDRRRTWTLLFMSEISLAVSTGRFGAITGLNSTGGFRPERPTPDISDVNYNFQALEALHRIYARALMLLAGLKNEMSPDTDNHDFRRAFNASWSQGIQAWRERWIAVNAQVQIAFLNAQTVLHSLSLHFPGPPLPVLEKCRSTALETVKVIVERSDASLLHGPNTLVTSIVYAATLLLRLESILPQNGGVELQTLLSLCSHTATTLENMAALRPQIRTFGGLHATRLRTLLAEFSGAADSASSSMPSKQPPLVNTFVTDDNLFDMFVFGDVFAESNFGASQMLSLPDWTFGEPGMDWQTSW